MNYKARRPKPLRACRMCKHYKYAGNGRNRRPHRDRKGEPFLVYPEHDWDVQLNPDGTMTVSHIWLPVPDECKERGGT